jgi:hypothetical protein
LAVTRFDFNLDLQRDVVKLSRITNHKAAGCMADCREFAVCNLLGLRVAVSEIQPCPQFAVNVLAVKHLESHFEVETVIELGRLHFTGLGHRDVPPCRNGLDCFRRRDCSRVKLDLRHFN